MASGKRNIIYGLGLLLVLIAWALLRSVPAHSVVFSEEGRTTLLAADPYFHLRHTKICLDNFPFVMRKDAGSNFPEGRRSENSGLFQVGLASLCLATGGSGDLNSVAATIAWTPIILGVLLLAACYLVGYQLAGPRAGFLAALFLLMSPGALSQYALLGFVDHHVWESLLAVFLVSGMLNLFGRGRKADWKAAAMAAIPFLLFFFSWPGSALHVLMLLLTLFVSSVYLAWRSSEPDELRKLSAHCLRLGALLLGVYGAVSTLFPASVMYWMNHKPLMLGLLILVVGFPLFIRILVGFRWPQSPTEANYSKLSLVALGVCFGIAPFLPTTGRLLHDLFGTRTRIIGEHGGANLNGLMLSMGVVLLLSIIGSKISLSRLSTTRIAPLLIVVPAWFYFSLWWSSTDFSYLVPPFLALLAALGLDGLVAAGTRIRAALCLFLCAVGFAVQLGAGGLPFFYLKTGSVERLRLLNKGWSQALSWVEERTPKPERSVNSLVERTESTQGYGIFSSWDFGHQIVALSERPVALNQTLSERHARWWLLSDESQFYENLADSRLRYVMTSCKMTSDFFYGKILTAGVSLDDYETAEDQVTYQDQITPLRVYGKKFSHTMLVRLQEQAGAGLSHFRLVYESPALSFLTYMAQVKEDGTLSLDRRAIPIEDDQELAEFQALAKNQGLNETTHGILYDASILPTVRVFEVVSGARLEGRAKPGDQVELSLLLKIDQNRKLVYQQNRVADEEGRFEITVPYATESTPHSKVQASGLYRLKIGSTQKMIFVAESQVQNGSTIHLGVL